MQTLLDLRYAARMLLKQPGFALVAVITLGLGIGANTAIFSVVNGVLLHPLPYREPERLVALWETKTTAGQEPNNRNEVALGNFLDWRAQQSVCDEIGALTYASLNLTGLAEPERIQGAVVTANLFQVLGVQPITGRMFLPEEENPASARAVIISNGLWQRRFGADTGLVGKTLTLNGNQHTVVGIMPPAFELQFPTSREIDMWVPMRIDTSNANRQSHYLYVLGRLKPGIGLEQAKEGMTVLAGQLEQQYPQTNADRGANVISLHRQLVGDVRSYIEVLFAAVGFVLLIACANVANLLLARVAARHKEVAIRTALGASRLRLVRQMLTESLLLSVLGGLLGLLLAVWGIDVLVALSPPDVPRLSEVGVHGPIFVWTLAVAIITGVLFGLAPALGASKSNLNESLKESGRSTAAPGRARLRNLLVVSEVALALVLLIGSGLMIRSFMRLQQVNPGFEPRHLLTMNVLLPAQKYRENQQINTFFDQLFERIRAVPGVDGVGGIDPLPLSNSNATTGFVIEGGPALAVADRPEVGERTVTPAYFEAMRIPVHRGREFTSGDREDTPRVVIINEALARRFWPGEEAVGKRLGFKAATPQVWHEVVGIVGDVKHQRLDADPKPEVYFAYQQYPDRFMSLVVRTAEPVEPGALITAIRDQVLAVDANQPVFDINTMDERMAKAVAPSRFIMLLLGVFAGLALILAAVGIYGVISYSVTQRTHEIGVRMALGAEAGDVLGLVVRQGMTLALAGIAVGLAGAFALTRLMSGLLFSVSSTDPLTFTLISLLLMGVALGACFVPARRATRVDPMIALRYE
ncbi:MAG TPA: ABC transporter permease [Blastocatellia bacterium]|nr:ABC transporter permease [Blastocatellia bacterium]